VAPIKQQTRARHIAVSRRPGCVRPGRVSAGLACCLCCIPALSVTIAYKRWLLLHDHTLYKFTFIIIIIIVTCHREVKEAVSSERCLITSPGITTMWYKLHSVRIIDVWIGIIAIIIIISKFIFIICRCKSFPVFNITRIVLAKHKKTEQFSSTDFPCEQLYANLQLQNQISAVAFCLSDWPRGSRVDLLPDFSAHRCSCFSFTLANFSLRLRNDLYCVQWGVKLYSLTPC